MKDDRVTYFEERTINIGNYESVKFGITYGGPVKEINKKESVVKISEMQSAPVESDEESFTETIKLLQTRVKKVLDKKDATLRLRAEDYVETYSATGKALMFKVLSTLGAKKKLAQIKADKEDIQALENDLEGSVFDNG